MTLELVSELKTKNGSTYADFYIVKGYHTINDGGGGEFYWDGTYLGDGNDGTIIAAKEGGITIGAWKRSYEGPVNLLWFGAKEMILLMILLLMEKLQIIVVKKRKFY